MHSPLRIGLLLQGNSNWVGGAEYTKNLLKALYSVLPEDSQDLEIVPLAEGGIETSLYSDMPERFHRHLRTSFLPRAIKKGYPHRILHRLLPWCKPVDPTVITAAKSQGIHFLYPCLPTPHDPRSVATASWIPDFQHKYLPQFFTDADLKNRDATYARVARDAQRVVLSSKVAARDFATFFPEAAHKIRVLSFRTVLQPSWQQTDTDIVKAQYQLPDRYFIVCNQFWQHKNHRIVFHALGLLKAKGVRPSLVCTGSLNDYRIPDMKTRVLNMLQEFGIADQVLLVGLIPRADQIQMIRRALAVVQPSLFEGWSTVVEDARVLGKRIILSSLDVHQEQNPPRATFFDPADAHALAQHIESCWDQASPGPDHDMERQAALQHHADLRQYAHDFLTLARC